MMDHLKPEDLVDPLTEDQLAHLQSCPSCRELWEVQNQVAQLLEKSLPKLTPFHQPKFPPYPPFRARLILTLLGVSGFLVISPLMVPKIKSIGRILSPLLAPFHGIPSQEMLIVLFLWLILVGLGGMVFRHLLHRWFSSSS